MAEKITLGEMKDLIRAENIAPSALFGVEDLTGDPLVSSFIDTTLKETRQKLSGEYEARKRIEKGTKETSEEASGDMKKKDDLIKKLQIDGAKRDAIDLFAVKMKERKLTPPQVKFVDAKKGNFTPTDPEKLDSEVDKFLDTQVEDCKEMGKLFGVKEEAVETKGGGEPGTGTGSGDVVDITPD